MSANRKKILGVSAIIFILLFAGYFGSRFGKGSQDKRGPLSFKNASELLDHSTWSSYIDTFTAAGICMIDANEDSRPDIFIPGLGKYNTESSALPAAAGNSLYLNRGLDGTGMPNFENVASPSGVAGIGKLNVGCAVADFDNDGREDLVVTHGTLGANHSAYGEMPGNGSTVRAFPPEFFKTDKTDGQYNFPAEGGISLFRNEGISRSGIPRFRNITSQAGLNQGGNATSAAWADVNNDGLVDLFVANYSDPDFTGFSSPHFAGSYNFLYRNNGDGSFTDVTREATIQGKPEFVYMKSGEKQYGWREDLKDSRGNVVGDPAGNTLAAAFFDYDGDGQVDLATADDIPGRIRLYRNLGNFRFSEVSEEEGMGISGAWMGIAIGDLNNDLRLDMFATNFGGEVGSRYRALSKDETYMIDILNPPNKGTFYNNLWMNSPRGFSAVTKGVDVDWGKWKPDIRWYPPNPLSSGAIQSPKPEGLERGEFGFGAVIFDYDNDGWQDLMWVGSLARAAIHDIFQGNPGRLLKNLGNGERFQDRAADVGVSNLSNPQNERTYQNGRGLAVADFNEDGYYDIVVTNGGGWDSPDQRDLEGAGYTIRAIAVQTEYSPGPTFLYLSSGGENNWLKVKLIGKTTNRSAIGAKITIDYQDEEGKNHKQLREIRAGDSYASQSSLEQIFGLGKAERVSRLTITWPKGQEQTLENLKPNQRLTIEEP